MPPKPAHKDLNVYYRKLRLAKNPIPCFRCDQSVLPKDFERHFNLFHRFNSKLKCVWCGKKSWNSSEKHSNACHLIACFEKFYLPPRIPRFHKPLPESIKLLIQLHLFPEKDHFGAVPLLIHSLYELIWLLPVEVKPLFQDENLNLAAAYVDRFLELRGTHEWYHVIVNVVVMPRFVNLLNKDGGTTRTLHFSCWCDGGPQDDPMDRHHRHLIVISPKSHFEKRIWAKVFIPQTEKPYPYKAIQVIESPMHLLNTLGHVSHRKIRCEFESKEAPAKLHHFYLYKTLPIDFKLPLSVLWDGGLEELLCGEKFQDVNLFRVIKKPVVSIDGQWKQKIKHFYRHERGFVVPVSKGLTPTRDIVLDPVCTFYLLDGDKLYFYHSQESASLDEETWIRKQAEGGNCFYDNVEELWWTMCKSDQERLSLIMPQMERNRELESKYTRLQKRY